MIAIGDKTIWSGWTVTEEIGHGSFGTVYKIERESHGNTVDEAAIKVISVPQYNNEIENMINDGYSLTDVKSHFKKRLASITDRYDVMFQMKNCPNIVSIDESRIVEHPDHIGYDYIVKMELLKPITRLPIDSFDEKKIISVARDICNALAECESKNFVHGDVKPQNIYVTADETYKLGDFGMSISNVSPVSPESMVRYVAPEILSGKEGDRRSDIYSLGLVLYWLLNNRRMPFLPLPPKMPSDYEIETARVKRISGEKFNAPIMGSRALREIVLKACSFDPEERYASALEMKEALDALIRGKTSVKVITDESANSVAEIKVKTVDLDDKGSKTVVDDAVYSRLYRKKNNANNYDKKQFNPTPLIFFLVVLALSGVLLMSLIGRKLPMPAVADLKLEDAMTLLNQTGFNKIEIEKDYDDEIVAGNVIKANYPVGTEVRKNETIKLTVSLGIEQMKVPDLSGKSREEAQLLIEEQKLKIKLSEAYNDKVAEGMVISQKPAAGTTVDKGSTVTVSVSLGKKPEPKVWTLTFNPNGGTVGETERKVTAGSAFGELPTPQRSDYVFIGWFTAAENGTQVSSETKMEDNDQTIYAVWGKIESHTLTFNANGGSVKESSRTVKTGSAYGTLPTPSRSGYSFLGWYTAASGGSKVSKDTKMGDNNVTVYAHWNKIASYTLTFNANGGSVKESSRTLTAGSAFGTLPTPTRSGYSFLGWFTTASGGTRVTKDTKMGNGNQTIYAHWSKVQTFTLTFNPNGGGVSETTRVLTKGSAYGTLPTPTRTDYIFDGWYTAASGGTKVSSSTTINADTTIYAHWTQNAFTVSWRTGTGYSITVKRTSSKNGGSIGNLTSGAKVYRDDVLSITYTAATGYTITSKGVTSITVSRNITSNDIYCNVSANTYTYTVVYVSSHGIALGTSSVSGTFGSSKTVTAPTKGGYNTPASQTVTFDSTGKTITFTYTPTSVSSTMTVTGNWWYEDGIKKMWYTCVIEFRNRTANSIEFRAKWTNTIRGASWYGYQQHFRMSFNGVYTAFYQIASASDFAKGTEGKERSRSNTTSWTTVTGLSPTTTSISITGIGYWKNTSTERCRFTKDMTIPTY